MNKRFLISTLVLTMVFVAVFPGTVMAADTYYVATTGSDATGDGSAGNPWATIQYAIDQTTSGDTINVAAGTYAEAVSVTESVTLLGAKHGVDPAGSLDRGGESVISGGNMIITADGVTVDGFKMTGGYIAAGYPQALDIVISYNILAGISAPWGAIHLHGSPDHECDGSYVGYNTISGVTGHGIWNVGNDDVTIEGNHILDVTGTGIDSLNHAGTGIEILDNTITNPGEKGINYWADVGGVIRGNTITGSGWEAIYTDIDVTIESNTIVDASTHGIVAAGHVATGIEILDNTITDPVQKGINYWAGAGGIICGNTITGSGWEAIFTDVGVTIKCNTVSNCYIGVNVYPPASDVIVHYNSIYQNSYGLLNYAEAQVDATLNWWGAASGPTHASNPSGTGDTVNDNVDFDPWLTASPPATVESTDSAGNTKDTFGPTETVYIIGSGYSPSTTYDLYVVSDVISWSSGMTIPSSFPGTQTSVTTDSNGDIPTGTAAWSIPVLGKYDIVIDVNGNGQYDPCIDALDDSDIEVTAGLNVIPEVPLGTVTVLLTALAALVVYKKRAATKT